MLKGLGYAFPPQDVVGGGGDVEGIGVGQEQGRVREEPRAGIVVIAILV